MQAQGSAGPFKRHKTRHRGITYRIRADGSRQYFAYAQGKQHPVHGGEREALAKQAELRGRLARGERVVTSNRTFGEVAEEWYEAKRSRLRPRVAAGYRTSLDLYVLPTLGKLKLGQVTVQRVAELGRILEEKGLARPTICNHLKPVRATFKFAIRRGMATYNPVDQLEPDELPAAVKREVRIPTPDEIEKLLRAAEHFGSGDYREMIELRLLGIRDGEVGGLEWGDFDRTEAVLHVRRQWTKDSRIDAPKTRASVRRVPLPVATVKMLSELKLRRPADLTSDDSPIFVTRTGNRALQRNVQRALATIVKNAGIEGLRLHDLRHAAASILIDRGCTPTEVAAVLGHANPNITMSTYAHLWRPESADEKVRAAFAGAMALAGGGEHA